MMKRIISFAGALIISTNGFAYQNVIFNNDGNAAILDYSKSSWANNVKKVKIYNCTAGIDGCTFEKEAVVAQNTISINTPGLYRTDFHDDDRAYGLFSTKVWEQFVYVQPAFDQEINAIADKYSPYLSFDKDEKFTPVSALDIFDRKLSDFEHISIPKNKAIDQAILAGQFMVGNGHKDAKLFLKQAIAKEIGKKDNFPSYWFHEIKDNKLYINYFWLFPYDYKANNGVPELDGAFNHAVDREGVTLVFDMSNGVWTPSKVIYAGHLDSQKITFMGCTEPLASCDTASKIESMHVSFGKNKSAISWGNVSKYNGRPIVYFAHGSHAAMPAFGWYKVETLGYDGLTERAGSNDLSKLKLGYTKSLSFSSLQSSEISLSFSGYLINVRWPSSNVRSYPFIRNPINGWFSDATSSMDTCIANKQGCEKYINQTIAPAITDLAFTPATANTAAKLTAIFSTDMHSGYSTTGAYVPKVGKEGYWPNARTFVVEFESFTPNGQITLIASSFKSVAGQPLAENRVYTFPQSSIAPSVLTGATVTDSCGSSCLFDRYGNPQMIVDGNLVSGRNLGTHSGYFDFNLAEESSISYLALLPAMSPSGNVDTEILTSSVGINGPWVSQGRQTIRWDNNVLEIFTLPSLVTNVKALRVQVHSSPSWVSLFEAYAYASGPSITPTPDAILNATNNRWYKMIPCFGQWASCRDAARAIGGELATVRSQAENTWLLNNLYSGQNIPAYIGLYRSGNSWAWSSGEAFNFTAWMAGRPDNFGGNQNFVFLSPGNQFWEDVEDGAVTNAIVEWPSN